MIFQFQRRTHNMNVMSVLLLGWTLWDPTTCGPVQLKAFFSTSYRETLKSKAVHHKYIYIYVYIYNSFKKQQQQHQRFTAHRKKATTWPNTSQEKWNTLRVADAVESAPVAAPAAPARRMRRKTRMEKGHAQQRLKDGGIVIYLLYILYIYCIYIYILYISLYDTICIYLNIIQYQHDVNM